jgi:hypothetical protein
MDWGEVFELRSFVWAVGLAAGVHSLLFLPALYFLRMRRSPWVFLSAVRTA